MNFFAEQAGYFASCLFALATFNLLKFLYTKFSTLKPSSPSLPKSLGDYNIKLNNERKEENAPKEPTFQEKVASIEKARGTRLVFLVTKEKSSGIFSLPSAGGIEMKHAREFVNTLRSIPDDENVDLIIDTPGGSFGALEVIANAISTRKGLVNAYVPFQATSGGALISLSADNVYMGKGAFLGPFDTQYYGFSVPSIQRNLPTGEGSFSPLWNSLREFCSKDIARTDRLVRKILAKHNADEEQFYDTFVNGKKYEHCQPLFYEKLKFISGIEGPDFFPPVYYSILDDYNKKDDKPSSGGLLSGLF